MVGRHRGNNYMKMLYNKRQPMFNRAVKAKYPPGSTFKLVQGLIGLQEGVLTPADRHSCNGGFRYGHRMMKCHAHASPLDLRGAVANSCNAYFCYVLRNILETAVTKTSNTASTCGKPTSTASASAASWNPTF